MSSRLRAGSQRVEPLQLITVSDRRAPAPPSRRAWWVVPLVLAGTAGGFAAGRTTAPTKQVIVTVTLPAITAQPTSTVRTPLAPATAPLPITTAVAPPPTTAAPAVTTVPTTVAAPPETTAAASPPETPVVSSAA